jgi:tRNA pseudouridine38-40 synthase
VRNIKLTVAYDGTPYCGWQIQPDQVSVQGLLGSVLSRITQEEVSLDGAGRTDAGVHAWGQVANFWTESRLSPQEFAHALNGLLPAEIRARTAEEAEPDFHARRCAVAKTYRYSIDRGTVLSPFRVRYALHHPYPLDFAAMAEAASRFEGEHDFTTFAASSGSPEEDRERNMCRTIYCSEMIAGSPGRARHESLFFDPQSAHGAGEWIYVVRGQSFLRHMVRKIVGTLLEVGRGRLQPGEVPSLFELRDRTRSGPTAPAHGLCLVSVEYPEGGDISLLRQEQDGLQ